MDRETCAHFSPVSLPCAECEIEARDAEIERLRNDVAATTGLLVRANDENERLTARVLELENELVAGVHTCGPTCRKTPACAERADLREEIERLRAEIAEDNRLGDEYDVR